jgi:hypothetical protein
MLDGIRTQMSGREKKIMKVYIQNTFTQKLKSNRASTLFLNNKP